MLTLKRPELYSKALCAMNIFKKQQSWEHFTVNFHNEHWDAHHLNSIVNALLQLPYHRSIQLPCLPPSIHQSSMLMHLKVNCGIYSFPFSILITNQCPHLLTAVSFDVQHIYNDKTHTSEVYSHQVLTSRSTHVGRHRTKSSHRKFSGALAHEFPPTETISYDTVPPQISLAYSRTSFTKNPVLGTLLGKIIQMIF